MKHPVRWSLLSSLAVTLAVAWLARAADSAGFVAGPAAAPSVANGSLYPAPQVDGSAPPAPPAPTF
jgi:hypothetical protein